MDDRDGWMYRERESVKSMLSAQLDDDDEIYIYIYIYIPSSCLEKYSRRTFVWKHITKLNLLRFFPQDKKRRWISSNFQTAPVVWEDHTATGSLPS